MSDSSERDGARLPTWREFLFSIRPDTRKEFERTGPAGVLSLYRALGFRQPFLRTGDPLPGEVVRRSVVRDPDGTEHVVAERWVKLEKP